MGAPVHDDTALGAYEVRETRGLAAGIRGLNHLLLAEPAVEKRAEPPASTFGVGDPWTQLKRRLVTDVPHVPARELGNPVAVLVLMKPDDLALHGVSVRFVDAARVQTPHCLPPVTLGPGQMPPQGARALIGELVGGRRNGPEVAATLDESRAGDAVLEFVNEGIATAVALRCVYRDPTGALVGQALGNLPPGGTATCRVHVDAGRPFRCVWVYDGRRGARLWSYDGRSRRVRGARRNDDAALHDSMYG